MKKYILFSLAALALSLTACEDTLDNVNSRPDEPTNEMISPDMQITNGIMATGYTTSSGSLAWYASSYTEQLVGVGANQMMQTELRRVSQVASSGTFDNEWNGTYGNILNLKLALAKAEEGGAYSNQVDVRGMIKTMLALNYGMLTDLFGDIPCSEAGESSQPRVDSQEAVYNEIFSLLNSALSDFESANESGASYAGSHDILYNGDLSQWEAFVYALTARYKLHLMHVDSNAAAEALAAAQTAKELGFEGAEITGFSSYTNNASNPWAAYWEDRNYNAASTTVNDILVDRNDPRQPIYLAPWTYNGAQVLADQPATPGDSEDAMVTYGVSVGAGFAIPAWLNGYEYAAAEAASIHLLSKAELYFILAELEARNGSDYNADLTTAVEASFADYGSFGIALNGTAADYVASLSSRLQSNAVKEILVQKYISQCRDEQIETYNDLRRTNALGSSDSGYEYVALTNPLNTQNGVNRWPLRYPYGNSDVVANPNVSALYGDGMYVYTQPIWWAN